MQAPLRDLGQDWRQIHHLVDGADPRSGCWGRRLQQRLQQSGKQSTGGLVGVSSCRRDPLWPGWPPRFLLEGGLPGRAWRSAGLSVEGGLLELPEFWPRRAQRSSSSRRNSTFSARSCAFSGLSNTLDTPFCIDALAEALGRFGRPEIFNSDQGYPFTAQVFADRLLDAGVAISRDGKGRCLDNVFAERLWRSLKYEEVYLKGYDSIAEARREIGVYLDFFNDERPHQGSLT